MPSTRLEVTIDGRRITVVNTWFSGEWLEVDGVVVHKTRYFTNTQDDRPLLYAVARGDSGRDLHIEVFLAAYLRVRMMIAVNGERVAGDRMNEQEHAAARRAADRLRSLSSGGGTGSPVAVSVIDRADEE